MNESSGGRIRLLKLDMEASARVNMSHSAGVVGTTETPSLLTVVKWCYRVMPLLPHEEYLAEHRLW